MHFRFMIRQLGLLLLLVSASMVFSGIVSVIFKDGALSAFAWSVVIGVVCGGVCLVIGRGDHGHLGRREALLLVSGSWFVGGLLAALPFWLWARGAGVSEFQSFVNCYFEAMSGLTTTGATVLSEIPLIPKGLLFWRAFTHWLGGLGIVVLFVAVLPLIGVGGKRLFRIETTGVGSEGVTPRIAETARILWIIYLGMTVAETLLLCWPGGMDLFDALTHTFATLATGGFSTHNESAGAAAPIAQWIIIGFMVLAGVNFGLYHQLLRGRGSHLLRDSELRAYVAILLGATVVIAINLHGTGYKDMAGQEVVGRGGQLARDAAFQVVSLQTTTGFSTADFDAWPMLSKVVLVAVMFVGGCGGSTGGGIKVIRIVIAVKVMWAELERAFRPNVVRTVRVGSVTVDDRQRMAIVAYVLGIAVLCVLGTGLLVLTEGRANLDETTALTTVIATVNNIGPGLSKVGATQNYGWFSDSSKLLLCVFMAVGRLEVFPVLVILMPRFWRSQ